jgi:hypothetical protein
MSPSNKETADLIRRVAGITGSVIPPQAALPKGGQKPTPTGQPTQPAQPRQSSVIPTDWDAVDKQTEESENFVQQVAQGGMNAIGYAFRVITGLGRGFTNAYSHMLPATNDILKIGEEVRKAGGYKPEDIPKIFDKVLELHREGTAGFLKGVAISGLPQSQEWFESGDGKKLYETGADVFASEDFKEQMALLRKQGITVGNLGTPEAENVVATIPIPFMGDVVLNERQAWGLGWDVFTDPTSYATLGASGAAQGLYRGVSTTVAYQKAGKPANFADIAPKALPRPFYPSPTVGGKTRKLIKNTPLIDPTYTVANTSTLTYIAKEMGRGFMEAHRSRLHRITARSALMGSLHTFNQGVARDLLGKGEAATDEYIEEILGINRDQVLAKQREELASQGVTDPMEIARIEAETAAALNAQAQEIAKKSATWRGAFTSEESLATITRLAEENGITPIQEGAFQIADNTARGLRRTTPAVPKEKAPRFNSKAALSFSRAIESASDPKTGSGEFGSLWGAITKLDQATIRAVFNSLVQPIGYRERPAMEAKAAADAKATQTQDIIEATYGQGLNPRGTANRAPVGDMKAVDEAIPGTGKTRRVWTNRTSKELKQLMKDTRRAKDARQGAGSALTSPGKFKSFTQEDILNAPGDFLINLSKNYYEDTVMATAKSAKPWDELTTIQKAKITEQILNNPDVITPDVFNKSMVLPTVMAARVGYLAERDVVQTTAEYSRINWFKDQKYNPLTATVTHPKLRDFAFSKNELKEGGNTFSEITRLALTASGRIQDPDLNKTLRKLNVRLDSLYEGGDLMNLNKIAEILEEAHVAVIAKKRDAFLLKLKLENSGENGAENLVDPNLLDAQSEALLGVHFADLKTKGLLATEEEILDAVTKLDLIQKAQQEAGQKLTELGFDWMGIGKPAFLVLSRLESPTAFRAESTETKTFKEIQAWLKAPENRPTQPVLQKEYFAPIVEKLKEIEARPTTTQATKDAIYKIIRISIETLDGKATTSKTMVDPKSISKYFSLIGNVLRQLEDRVQMGTVVGFDSVFARKGGEYDQQAFLPFLEEAYRASRTQDSLDGGYFANKLDDMIKAKDKNAKPLHEQTPAEARQSLKSLGKWGGEGISAGLLHTIIRSTEKQIQKGKRVELPEAVVADIQRSYDALYNKMVDDLLREDSANYKIEAKASDVVLENTGAGNMERVIIEGLRNDAERAAYSKIVAAKNLEVDPNGNTIAALKKLYEAAKFTNLSTSALPRTVYASRDGVKWANLSVEDLDKLRPGDLIKGSDFTKLSFKLQNNAKKTETPLKGPLLEVWQLSRQLSVKTIFQTEARAARKISEMRAAEVIDARIPKFADASTMIRKAQSIGNTTKASVNWRARLWLATIIDEGDRGVAVREADDKTMRRLQKKASQGVDSLKAEQKEFEKILSKVELKLKKEYAPTKTNVSKMKVIDVIASKNDLDFLRKVRSMKVTNEQEEIEWDLAMTHLLNIQLVGKGSRYESFSQLAESYRTAARGQKPGEISKVTQRQIPTDEEVLTILSKMDGSVGTRAATLLSTGKATRSTVVNLLRRLDADIKKADLANAKALDFISATNIAGGEEVRRLMETLGDDKIVAQEIMNQLTIERMTLHDEGFGYIEFLAAMITGASNQQYFMNRAKNLKIAEVDALGRNIDVDKPSFTAKRTVSKRTYETTSILLTGWSLAVRVLSDAAKVKNLEGVDRQKFMVNGIRKTLRLRDLTLHAQGIFPTTTPSSKLGEPKLLGMTDLSAEAVIKASKPVYLTDADVLDIYPDEVVAELFFIGAADSLPITALLPAARLVVSAMDNLAPGAYFNAAEIAALQSKMAQLMVNVAKNSTITKNSKGLSHYDVNPEMVNKKILKAIEWMVDQKGATKLFEQHIINAAIATKVFKYQSGEVTSDITKAMLKMLNSSFASTGTKIQSIIDASEDIRALTGRKDLTPEVLLQADLDLNSTIAAQMTLDDAHVVQQILKMEEAAKTPAARKRLAGQKASTPKRYLRGGKDEGDYIKRVNQIRLELDKNRQEGGLYNTLAALRNLEEVKKGAGVDKDDPFDVFQDHGASDVAIRRFLKFGDAILSRMSYDYGMQNLRPLYAPAERGKVDLTSQYEIIGARMNKKWDQLYPDRNILGEAFKILQQVPDEVLDKALTARSVLENALANRKKTGERKLTPDEYAELIEDSKGLDPYLKLDDKDLNRAVIELWGLGGRILGGGEKSMINIDGITPNWLNRNLKEVGGGNKFTWIDSEGNYTQVKDSYAFTTKDSMGDIWREWDITNPIEMMITLNSALERAHVIPSIADSAVKNFGVPKSQYANLAAAKADGLVAIKAVSKISQGKELVHFMDTDGHYFPIQIAQELSAFSKFVSELKYIQREKGVVERVLRKFNVLTNMTKQIMTIWTPKNYIQSLIGGFWTNGYAGVNSPFAYYRAIKMLQTSGRNVKEVDMDELTVQMAQYEAIRGQDGFVIKEASDPRKSETMQVTVNGRKIAVSYGDIEKLANKYRLYVPVAQSREYDFVDEFRDVTTFGKAKTIAQKLREKYDQPTYWLGKKASERDNWLRAALFIDELGKANWKSLDQAAQAAMVKVDRYHPQLQGLTTFNQKYTRNYVLFFPWRSKMLGTIIADIFDRPGRYINVIRAQQAVMNSQEETESDVFGNMTPQGVPLPQYYKHNLDPIAVDRETGLMTKFSLANPATDLLGSTGWLSGIDFNSYEPFPDQVADLSFDLVDRLVWQSAPFILKELVNIPQGRTSTGTTNFMDGGFNASQDSNVLVQDTFNSLGFGVAHKTFAAIFGGAFLTAKMKEKDEQARWEEVQLAWRNWLSGLKATPLDTLDNRVRGNEELIQKIKTVTNMP